MKYELGKCDYNRSGSKNCKAIVEWELKDGCFSMSGEIWDPRGTDIYTGGQMADELVKYFPGDKKLRQMVAIWKEWHLNDLTAGTPSQQFAIKDWTAHRGGRYDYTEACEYLKTVGLYEVPDPRDYTKTYKYGHAWLKRELPEDVITIIKSW